MTTVLTVRIDPVLLEKAETKASMLGMDRAKYVRSLIEDDLASDHDRKNRGFVSTDLAGIYGGDSPSATNEEVRNRLSRRKQS